MFLWESPDSTSAEDSSADLDSGDGEGCLVLRTFLLLVSRASAFAPRMASPKSGGVFGAMLVSRLRTLALAKECLAVALMYMCSDAWRCPTSGSWSFPTQSSETSGSASNYSSLERLRIARTWSR